jgi:5-methylcytosine-specific restriction endonuclease McrBC regulatory subunit McrC
VWEDLLAVALRLAWGAQSVDVQKRVALGVRRWVELDGSQTSTVAWMRPDLSLSSGPGLLLDAKYKGRAGESRNRVSEADLYEALAFATAAKRQKVVLLFPAIARQGDVAPATGTTTLFETIQVGTVTVLGMEVEVRGIAGRGALRLFANGIFTAVEGLLNPSSGVVPTS